MFIHWQRSEIRRAHRSSAKLNSALRTHKLCHRCDCPRIEHAINYSQEDCEIRRRLFAQDVSPGWHTISVPVPGNRCSYGFEVEDGRVLYETRVTAILCKGEESSGAPKQDHIAFLGNIEASWLESFYEGVPEKQKAKARVKDWETEALTQRHWFWQSVTNKLDSLAERIPGVERRRLEGTISEVVPRPTSRESNGVEHRAREMKLRFAI